VLMQVAQVESSVVASVPAAAAQVSLPRGPSVGPPLIPIISTPVVLDPGSGGTVPTGGRGYAAP